MWPNGTVADLAARTHRFLVTRGKEGADEWRGPLVQRIPVFPVSWTAGGMVYSACELAACAPACTCFGVISSRTPDLTSFPLAPPACPTD